MVDSWDKDVSKDVSQATVPAVEMSPNEMGVLLFGMVNKHLRMVSGESRFALRGGEI